MPLPMTRPMKRPQSSVHQFRQRIPSDLLGKVGGVVLSLPVGDSNVTVTLSVKAREVVASLRTGDPREAKARNATVQAYLERTWQALRDGPRRLTHREAVALAGEVYVDLVAASENDPAPGAFWAVLTARLEEAREGRNGVGPRLMIGDDARLMASLEPLVGPLTDRVLARRSLSIDRDSRLALLQQVAEKMSDAAGRLAANARGDYSPDPLPRQLPAWQDKPAAAPKPAPQSGPSVTLTDLLAGWWDEAQRLNLSDSTYDSYAATIGKLRAFLGHDDAGRVTADDVVGFKDHRLASFKSNGERLSPRTVKENDLAGLKSVVRWAVANRKLPANPATGVTVGVARQVVTRSKGLTDKEAHALLTAATAYASRTETARMVAAKQWVPWLCAFTGARIGEMGQLRKQDVRQEGNVWVVDITPNGGPVKDKEARTVPIHAQVLELGFVRFVQAAPAGYLFVKATSNKDVRGPLRGLKNRLNEWARQYVPDAGVRPFHGWRHRFKTEARRAQMALDVHAAITGHARANVGDGYGDYPPDVMATELDKLPRYPVPEGAVIP